MFYKDFAEDYEQIFPYSVGVYSFLKGYLTRESKNILDIGCATGHYCGRFSSEGYNSHGIDLDSAMISTAAANYKDPKFTVLNLTDLEKLDSSYDFIYSTGNVMAHVPADDFRLFVKSLKHKLINKGIWIFQVINWDYITKLDTFDFPLIETDTRTFIRKYTDITEDDLLFNTELKNKPEGDSVFKDRVKMYPLSSEKYIKIHEDEGFKLLGHFADYSKKEFSQTVFSANIFVFSL